MFYNVSSQQIYLTVYGGKGTKAERALEGLEDKVSTISVSKFARKRRPLVKKSFQERKEQLSRRETRRIKESRGEDLSSSSDDDDNQIVVDDRKSVR